MSELTTQGIRQKWLDLPYAYLSSAQTLDLYLPNDRKPTHPILLLIHAGGFRFGDKTDGEIMKVLFPALERGYGVAAMNYRLSTEEGFPAPVMDVNAAIRFLRKNETELRLDGSHIGLWGFSAGGNLASLAGVTSHSNCFYDPELGEKEVYWNVQAVVDFYGPVDFLAMDDQFRVNGENGQIHQASNSFETLYMGARIDTIPKQVRYSNPETYLTGEVMPFYIAHGTRDQDVPYQQSVIFSEAIRKASHENKVHLRLLDGAEHGDAAFFQAKVLEDVFKFLNPYLKIQIEG